MSKTLQEQRQRLTDLQTRASAIYNNAGEQHRDLSADETQDVDAALDEGERVHTEILRLERLEGMQIYTNGGSGSTLVVPTVVASGQPPRPAPGNGNGNGQPPRVPFRVEVNDSGRGTYGFRNMGEWAQAVRNAGVHAGRGIDPRLFNAAQVPNNIMTEGVNSDGGYAVPPDFRADINVLIAGEDSLLPRTDQLQTASNAITVPIDSTTPWDSAAGIQAYWDVEAAIKKSSKAALDNVTVRLNKLYALVPVSDELLEDAPALGTLLQRKAPEKIQWKINDAILNGTGNGMPQGIYTSPATIIVKRDAAQPVKTITAANVLAMWAAMWSGSRANSVWVTNQDVEALLPTTFIPIMDSTGKLVNGQVSYLPPGGLSQSPYGTLLGRPVIVTEATPDLGQTGDIALIDFKQYLSAIKVNGGIKFDVSQHIYFDMDLQCYRWVIRIGGVPWWKGPVWNKAHTTQRSPFVVLGGDGVTALEAPASDGGSKSVATPGHERAPVKTGHAHGD